MELTILSRRVATPAGLKPAAVVVRDGRIESVVDAAAIVPGDDVLDVGDRVLLPGLVDCHVHVNEPGRTEWEGFTTATAAAAAGGITTIVDMPLNSDPVTTSRKAFETKLEAAQGKLKVDAAFWGGVVPGNAAELEPMLEAGVVGFKCFLVHSGIDEFPDVKEADLRKAMPVLAAWGAPLIAHAELCPAGAPAPSGDPRKYRSWLASRPKSWENEAVSLLLRLCRETGCRVHIVHLSSAEALPLLAQARQEGLPFTAETCPHYLFFDAEGVPDGGTEYKCAPPIRERSNREALWKGLEQGLLSFVVSDHSPCVSGLKKREAGDFLGAWGGISGLQFGLPALWTEARKRGFGPEHLARWMSEAPAAFCKLGRKGRIEAGRDADFCVFDPDAGFTVDERWIEHKNKLTPYLGRELFGRVDMTLLRGAKVFGRRGVTPEAQGRMILLDHERVRQPH